MTTQSILRAYLAIAFAQQIGPARFASLLQRFKHPQSVLSATTEELIECACPPVAIQNIQSPNWELIDAHLRWSEQTDATVLTWFDDRYPERLRVLEDAPPVLFVRGNVKALNYSQLAIVGSRHPSVMGEENAYLFARELASAGLAITSGLAVGIDAAAHRGALAAEGITLAIAGTGLDRVYPAQHHALACQIIENDGAIISEFPLGTRPLAANFPRRNRIISGLGAGVLVVEAAPESGSLITARCALEQGREVFALPGSIHNTHAKGCHELIRQGAKLVDSIAHILEELPVTFAGNSVSYSNSAAHDDQVDESSDEATVLHAIDDAPTSVDTIISRCKLTADAVCSILLTLELQGKVQMTAAGQYCRVYLRVRDEAKYSRCVDVSF